ncbi:ferredoxin [Streptomyces sp. NPDC002446]
MALTVSIDRDRCVGAGMCVLTAPGVFDQDDEDGRVLLLTADPPADRTSAARSAAGFCPAQAITVTDPTAHRP